MYDIACVMEELMGDRFHSRYRSDEYRGKKNNFLIIVWKVGHGFALLRIYRFLYDIFVDIRYFL